MSTPLLSIIIPVYNVEKYLQKCLDSILIQNIKYCEIICVNDGSTDYSSDILDEYKLKYPRLIKIDKENGGLSEARNCGIDAASGKYLLFLDSDDWLKENALQIIYDSLSDNEIEILAFNPQLYFESEKTYSKYFALEHKEPETLSGLEFFNKFVQDRKYGPSAACFYCYKRSLLNTHNIRFKDGILHEDELFMPIVLFHARRVKIITDKLYVYRIRSGSITQAKVVKHAMDKIIIAKELFDFSSDKEFNTKYYYRNIYNLSLSAINELIKANLKERLKQAIWLLKETKSSKKESFVYVLLKANSNFYKFYLFLKSFKSKATL